MTSTTTTATPTVWVGCLACYNSGRLIGEWVPAIDADDVTPEDIHGRTTAHEELWVMDTDGLPISREMSPDEAAEWGAMLSEVEEWQRDALAAWVASGDYVAEGRGDLSSLPDFEERFAGEWASFAEYAESLADDIGLMDEVPDGVAAYFDWAAWTRDLAYDYTTASAPNGGVFVFRSL